MLWIKFHKRDILLDLHEMPILLLLPLNRILELHGSPLCFESMELIAFYIDGPTDHAAIRFHLMAKWT